MTRTLFFRCGAHFHEEISSLKRLRERWISWSFFLYWITDEIGTIRSTIHDLPYISHYENPFSWGIKLFLSHCLHLSNITKSSIVFFLTKCSVMVFYSRWTPHLSEKLIEWLKGSGLYGLKIGHSQCIPLSCGQMKRSVQLFVENIYFCTI